MSWATKVARQYNPFQELERAEMQKALLATICHVQNKYKAIYWPNILSHYESYKKYYFDAKDGEWIEELDNMILARIKQVSQRDKMQFHLGKLIGLLQYIKKQETDYFPAYNRTLAVRSVRGLIFALNNPQNVDINKPGNVDNLQNGLMLEISAVIRDAIAEPKPLSKWPLPKDLKKYSELLLKEEKFENMYMFADMCEEEGFDEEAAHFRQGVHTWCCPVLRKLAGK